MVLGQAIVCDRQFIRGFGLRQLAAVEKNVRAMFVVFRHELSAFSNQP